MEKAEITSQLFEAMKDKDGEMSDGTRELLEAMETAGREFESVLGLMPNVDELTMEESMVLAGLLASLPPSARSGVQPPDALTSRILLMILSSEVRVMQRIEDLERRLLNR
jgi:hypothetical protein